jgi:hypothetical protein
MSDPVDVCEAVIERLRPVLLDWNLLLSEPSPIPLPAVVVEIVPAKGADYVQNLSSWTQWFLQIKLFASAIDQEGSLRLMAPLAGTYGPIRQALEMDPSDIDDALTRLSNGVVQVTTLMGFGITRRNRARYRTGTLLVTVGAN